MSKTRKLSEEDEKNIKLLQVQNEMLEHTKEEAKMRGNKDAVRRIEIAQDDGKRQIQNIIDGAEPIQGEEEAAKEIIENKDENAFSNIKTVTESNGDGRKSIFDILEKNRLDEEEARLKKQEAKKYDNVDTETIIEDAVQMEDVMVNNVSVGAHYDVIPLPSNGECYKSKVKRIPVGYLTAYDENLITSPNLYQEGLIIDFLLRNKIMNKEVNVDELVSGDADAIILFLRATSYGTDFPISVKDPETGELIETTLDLSTLKPKKFDLKGDENGWFEYVLPKTKSVIKFRYLTRKDEKDLNTLNNIEDNGIAYETINNNVEELKDLVKNFGKDLLSIKERQELYNAFILLKRWADKIGNKDNSKYNHAVTNKMEMQIMSVNGNTDREYIRNAIMSMPAYDSLSLRRYILDNEPGIDFNITIERPESLGGGSFETFLNWDDTVFLNIT